MARKRVIGQYTAQQYTSQQQQAHQPGLTDEKHTHPPDANRQLQTQHGEYVLHKGCGIAGFEASPTAGQPARLVVCDCPS